MVNWVANPLAGLTGVTLMTGVIFSDQLSRVPVAPVLELEICSVQTPGIHVPAAFRMSTVWPSRLASVPVGLKVPVNGAVPVVIEFSAASSRVVLTKLAPLVPPTLENKGTCVPSGAISTALSDASDENARLRLTDR